MKRRIFLVVLCLGGLAMTGRASLVAWYKFDEAAGATTAANAVADNSAGVIGSNVTTGLAGISGGAYRFAGGVSLNDIVDVGNASFFPAFTASGQLTFSAWINTTDVTGNRNTVLFAGSDTISNNYADLGLNGPSGEATARNRPAGASGEQQAGIFGTGVVVNDGTWHNVVMTIDLSYMALFLYVNGTLANAQSLAAAPAFPSFNTFEIGRLGRAGTPVDGFEGLIDDVQVYDTALSEEQVLFLFNNPGVAVPEPGAFALAAVGLGFLYFVSRRRRARASG